MKKPFDFSKWTLVLLVLSVFILALSSLGNSVSIHRLTARVDALISEAKAK